MVTFVNDLNGFLYLSTDDFCEETYTATRMVLIEEGNPLISCGSKETLPNTVIENEADAVLWVETGILPDYMKEREK